MIIGTMAVSAFGGPTRPSPLGPSKPSTLLVGFGLAARLGSMNIYKLASYGLVVIGLAGFINMVLALLLSDPDVVLYLTVSQLLLFVGSVCLFVIGAGLYGGQSELAAEGSPS